MWLNFSDAAKYADIARNLLLGNGFGINFTFFWPKVFENLSGNVFPALDYLPFMPLSMYVFFRLFGAGDLAVVVTSAFYFILTLPFVYLLAKKLFNSKLTGILSTLAFGFNYELIHYASSGASESPFIFEIVAASYFISLKNKWGNMLGLLFLILMYFTRPQAFIYISGILLYGLLINFNIKKALIYFFGALIIGGVFDYFVLKSLSGNFFLYSVIHRAVTSSFNQTSVASDSLRGETSGSGIIQLAKNVFYNLYNFYKLTPQILSPYFLALFVMGIFIKTKDKIQNSFKMASVFMIIITLLITAASIPFFRYIHPVIPFVYIIGVGTLVEIISKFEMNTNTRASKQLFVSFASLFVVLVFGVGQTIGVFLLDSRFEKNSQNIGKPPVYVQLSKILKENTSQSDVIITNLDTWGSWYGERKTVWFPLSPKQIVDPITGKIPFDAIYLTSYLIDDQNYYMGESWRTIFDNPKNPDKWTCEKCGEIAKEFKLKSVFVLSADDNYERLNSNAVLFVKK